MIPRILHLAACASFLVALASAGSVPVLNYDFELPATGDGVINTSGGPTGWTFAGSGNPGIFNPSATQSHYTGMGAGDANGGVLPNMVGPSLGFMFPGNGNTGKFSQTVGAVLEAETEYTLTVAIGQRNYFNNGQVPSDFRIALETATTGTIVAEFIGDVQSQNPLNTTENTTGTIVLTESTFTDFSATATTSASPTGLGEDLVIVIQALAPGRYLDVDNVRLDTGGTPPPANPDSININFGITLDDANRVDADESSTVGLAGAATVTGSGWNNVLLKASGNGAPTDFTTATQGGSHLDVLDASGADSGIDMTSSGTFFSNVSNVSSPNQVASGDAGMLQSFLLLDSTESVTLTGLSSWSAGGYQVRAFFDIGPSTRTYGITMTDGGLPTTLWTADSAATDSDPDNDGTISWTATTATSEGSAVADANHAVFGPFTGDTLTISGAGSNGRAVLSGIQILPITEPIPSIVSFTASPESFTPGGTVTLSWEVNDADSVTIDNGVETVPATGTIDLIPAASTTWTLTATRGGISATAQATASATKGPITVYLLGGQSNMQGTARSSLLPAELLSIPEILFFAAGSSVSGSIANQLVGLQPGGGSTFGPEIGFGSRLTDLCPGEPIALIKYAVSGTSLELDWAPGTNSSDTGNWGPQFAGFVNTVNNGLAALVADGWDPEVRGMCWFQGEQDAKDGLNAPESSTSADDYGANLTHLISRIREQFAANASEDGIRFVPGQVLPYAPPGGDVTSRFPGRDLVRQAIMDLDEASGLPASVSNTSSVATDEVDHPTHEQVIDGFRDTDEVHLAEAALLNLGNSMAYAMIGLKELSYSEWASGFGLVGDRGDDDDGDGLSNEAEYLFKSNPTLLSDARFPVLDLSGDAASLTIRRNLEATDLIPDSEFSADLSDWTSLAPVLRSSARQPDGTLLLIFESPIPFGDPAGTRGFFRTISKAP